MTTTSLMFFKLYITFKKSSPSLQLYITTQRILDRSRQRAKRRLPWYPGLLISGSGFWEVFWILGSVLDSGKCSGSGKCFEILASVLDSGKCFSILASVFGSWEVFMDSGKCFEFREVFMDSGIFTT